MYSHVCENGGTRDVLPPRPSQRFMFKDLLESPDREERSNPMLERLRQTRSKETYTALECARRPTRHKIVPRACATIRGRLSTYVIDSSKG